MLDPAAQCAHLVRLELARGPQRVDAGAPERLVHVDVPESGEGPLVEQRSLHRRLAVRQARGEGLRRERATQRLTAEAPCEVRAEPPRLDQPTRSEAATAPAAN